jgi:FkbM family methyltransferase
MSLRRFIPENVKGYIVLAALRMGRWFRKLGIQKITRDGVTIDVVSPLISDGTVGALFWRVYEWGERRAIRDLLADYPVIELGASLGFISCLAALRTPLQKEVVVEANPNLLPLLTQNIQRNGFGEKIEVVWAAIDYSGDASVQLELGGGSNLSASVTSGEPEENLTAVNVPTTTLGRLLRERHIEKYVLICDIEGAEVGLLQEEAAVIAGCQQLIIEVHKTLSPEGIRLTPTMLGEMIVRSWGMSLRKCYGPVLVLQRSSHTNESTAEIIDAGSSQSHL